MSTIRPVELIRGVFGRTEGRLGLRCIGVEGPRKDRFSLFSWCGLLKLPRLEARKSLEGGERGDSTVNTGPRGEVGWKFIDNGRVKRRLLGESPVCAGLRGPLMVFWPSARAVTHGDSGRGKSNEARPKVMSSSALKKFEDCPCVSGVLRFGAEWDSFSKCDRSEDTGFCGP